MSWFGTIACFKYWNSHGQADSEGGPLGHLSLMKSTAINREVKNGCIEGSAMQLFSYLIYIHKDFFLRIFVAQQIWGFLCSWAAYTSRSMCKPSVTFSRWLCHLWIFLKFHFQIFHFINDITFVDCGQHHCDIYLCFPPNKSTAS